MFFLVLENQEKTSKKPFSMKNGCQTRRVGRKASCENELCVSIDSNKSTLQGIRCRATRCKCLGEGEVRDGTVPQTCWNGGVSYGGMLDNSIPRPFKHRSPTRTLFWQKRIRTWNLIWNYDFIFSIVFSKFSRESRICTFRKLSSKKYGFFNLWSWVNAFFSDDVE